MPRAFLIDSVWKAFGERAVLKGATVWAEPGRVTLLLGGNGSGKSTLLRCATGLVRADRGLVLVDGRPVPPRLDRLAREGVFLWPDTDLLSRRRTVGWHLDALRRSTGRDAPAEAREACAPFLDRLPDELSGGERRRCELAMARAAHPRVLLADEPLMGIAPIARDDVCRALRSLADTGTAVLVTGHEVEDLLALADEVVWITAGTTHGLGSAMEARGNWAFRKEYLAGRA